MTSTTEFKSRIVEILSLIEEAKVPESLYPTVFTLLWSEQPGGARVEGPLPGTSAPVAELARRTDLSQEHVADLYSTSDDGMLTVHVPARQLAPSKTRGTVELALLVCAGRQVSGEQATHARVIRQVCDHYGKLDSPNFSSAMKSGDAYWQIAGKGSDTTFTLRRPGWEEAAALMKRLAGA